MVPYIQEKVDFLTWKLTKSGKGQPIKDKAAWLIRAIEKNYQPPEGYKTKAQREQQAIEETTRAREHNRQLATQLEEEQKQKAQEERKRNWTEPQI